ncbi:MAG: recombinase zinc beta ribbon domain-containing protein, partial [bacterium]
DLSQNTKRGLRTKAERGWYPTFASLGFMHNPLKRKGEKEIIKDPERFNLVRKMFDLMLTGNYFPPKILEIATDKWGLRNRFGKKVARSTIYRIFTDPFYYGQFEYPKGSGNWFHGKHEPMITEEQFNRIQTLLGRDGKPCPHTHTFTFRGLMRCGECGAMITAEKRVKKQKNGNVHQYIYYHCTKRRNPNCTQGCIEEEKLKEQILQVLNSVEIPPQFHDWALEDIKSEIIKESGDRNSILTNQQKAYNDCVREIDGVISMRAKKELDEENYKRKMAFLTKEKARLKELLADTDDRVNKQIAKLERAFALAKDGKKEFESNDPERQKQILSNLGSNLLLKDKILTISIENPLIQIKGMVPEVRAIHNKVRTSKNAQNEQTLRELYAQSPTLLRRQDSNLF